MPSGSRPRGQERMKLVLDDSGQSVQRRHREWTRTAYVLRRKPRTATSSIAAMGALYPSLSRMRRLVTRLPDGTFWRLGQGKINGSDIADVRPMIRYPCSAAPRLARTSARSLPGSPLWPFTHRHLMRCLRATTQGISRPVEPTPRQSDIGPAVTFVRQNYPTSGTLRPRRSTPRCPRKIRASQDSRVLPVGGWGRISCHVRGCCLSWLVRSGRSANRSRWTTGIGHRCGGG